MPIARFYDYFSHYGNNNPGNQMTHYRADRFFCYDRSVSGKAKIRHTSVAVVQDSRSSGFLVEVTTPEPPAAFLARELNCVQPGGETAGLSRAF